jgi:D-glycero-alpha-D-manno-heptose-7-phosphate kinase
MIVVRTPFRISFVGGGSDLPSYYRRNGGAVVSASIDKYMFIVIHPYFHDKIRIKYSRMEDVDCVADIEHPIVRECLIWRQIPKGMEIASFADVPAGTGLGSSSAFTVGLLHALHAYQGEQTSPAELAAAACNVEIDRLGEPIGKQDQYACAFGGINFIRFHADEQVNVEPIGLDAQDASAFERNLLLFYLGQERSAGSILSQQSQNMLDPAKWSRVDRMVELAERFRSALELRCFDDCGDLLNEHWLLKRELADGISNDFVEQVYTKAMCSGASGGKLLGAGGGGFLLLYCKPESQASVRRELSGLREMPFRFSSAGSRVIFSDELSLPEADSDFGSLPDLLGAATPITSLG